LKPFKLDQFDESGGWPTKTRTANFSRQDETMSNTALARRVAGMPDSTCTDLPDPSGLKSMVVRAADQSHGDMVTWSADVFNEMPANRKHADGTVVGIASGYMIVTRPNHEVGTAADVDREFRVSTMTMSWNGTDDSIIFTGLHAYGHDAPRLDNTVTRPVVGGTGRFLGRAGVAAVIPEGEAWFRVEIYLADHR
jgi:hypothetical protein